MPTHLAKHVPCDMDLAALDLGLRELLLEDRHQSRQAVHDAQFDDIFSKSSGL